MASWTDEDHQILLLWKHTRSWREISVRLGKSVNTCFQRWTTLEAFYATNGRYPTAAELVRQGGRRWTFAEDEQIRQGILAQRQDGIAGKDGGKLWIVAVRLAPILSRTVNAVMQRIVFLDFDEEELTDGT